MYRIPSQPRVITDDQTVLLLGVTIQPQFSGLDLIGQRPGGGGFLVLL